jgi:hypothetical protein
MIDRGLRARSRLHGVFGLVLGATLAACSSGSDGTPAPSSTAVEVGPVERAPIADDFDLVDPDGPPTAGLDGVLPSLSDLPIATTKRTMRYVDLFANHEKGRKGFEERYRRAGRYEAYIEQRLQDADLPEDLVWVAAIESSMSPQATSPAGAAGLFQFIPETADRFGLFVGSELDERRSITKSTDAAIALLGYLHDTFGAWDLALAAYSCGESRLEQALEDARAALHRGPEEAVEFRELAELGLLPKETLDYVPKVHAFAIAVHNREILHLDGVEPLPPMQFAEIAVPGGTRLAPIAKAAGISVATLREYNPDLLSDRLSPGFGDMLVEVPADRLEQTLAALPAHLARDLDATEGVDDADVAAAADDGGYAPTPAARPKKPRAHGSDARPQPGPTLKPAPMRPGAYVLDSGVFVTLDPTTSTDVTISATVAVLDPTKGRAPLGEPIRLEPRTTSKAGLVTALDGAATEVRRAVLEQALPRLRERLAVQRGRAYEKTGFGGMFGALGTRAFPASHPMHGALLVGPTEPADDMFLEPEPTWALDVTVALHGPIEQGAVAQPLERAFADTFAARQRAPLPASSQAATGKTEQHVLVGWVSPALEPADAAADHLAFLLACHNRLGRWHRQLRLDRKIAGRVGCSLEIAPQATVAWVLASPATPYAVPDADKTIDAVVRELTTTGPTDVELDAARGLLRAELAKERDSATLRGMPKSRIIANNEALLRDLSKVDRAKVIAAAQRIFPSSHRIEIVGDAGR